MFIQLIIFIIKTNCVLNNGTEFKSINIFNNPILVDKLWDGRSCLTFKASIGTCLTLNDCKSINGTVGGLCLGLYPICCQLEDRPLNSECITQSNRTGICLSHTECAQRLGTPEGSCSAGGLTTCCRLESNCGKSVKHNETYFVNDLYPYSTTHPNVCQIQIERQPNVCQIRLDLLELNLAQPDSTGKCTTDALIIKTPSGEKLPIICGDNSGQHLYIEIRRKVKTKPIRLSIITNGNTLSRKWKIRVVMIECNSTLKAPNGCLQYYPYVSSIVRSFNFGEKMIGRARYMSDLSYTVCVRVEENHCWIQWQTQYEDTFSWGTHVAHNQTMSSNGGQFCTSDDFIAIDGGLNDDKAPTDQRLCGTRFSTHNYIINIRPFDLKVRSNSDHGINSKNSQKGFSLIYTQIECFDEPKVEDISLEGVKKT